MSFITRKHLSRRILLRGVGVSLGLPLLDSMIPAQTPLARTAATSKSRLSCIYVPHGATLLDSVIDQVASLQRELPAGAGVPRRDHPRCHADVRARYQRRGLSAERHSRRVPRREELQESGRTTITKGLFKPRSV